MSTILRLLLPLATALAGMSTAPASFAGSPASRDLALLSSASLRLSGEAPNRVMRWLRTERAIRSVDRGRDGQTIDIRFRDGLHAAILPPSLGSTTLRVSALHHAARFRPLALGRSPNPARALVLEPFASELQLGQGAGNEETTLLQGAGFQVDMASDTNVTVQTMATLSGYNVVYMHTHSGLTQTGDGIVATGEPFTGDPALAPLLQSGAVIPVNVAGSSQQYYGVTSRFILGNTGTFPRDSLLFLNGCSLLSANSFWQALASHGAGVLVSWNRESTAQDNYLAGAAFFNEMSQGMSVSAAVATEQAAGIGRSMVNGQEAVMGYLGDGTITLDRARQGAAVVLPTATPLPTNTQQPAEPTATATPEPPTATPTPTLVRPSPLPLQVALKTHVDPGSIQVITARSTPGVTVRFQVHFPNGNGLSSLGTTDASGVAQFSYRQAASMVTHGNVVATVSVTARNASAASVHAATYRIGWSKVDVSAQPRLQSPGRSVTIWVHTRPHTRVTLVFLTSGGGRSTQVHAQTGPHGWKHLPYGIARQARSGNVIVVRAAAQLGRSVYWTGTTVLVR